MKGATDTGNNNIQVRNCNCPIRVQDEYKNLKNQIKKNTSTVLEPPPGKKRKIYTMPNQSTYL